VKVTSLSLALYLINHPIQTPSLWFVKKQPNLLLHPSALCLHRDRGHSLPGPPDPRVHNQNISASMQTKPSNLFSTFCMNVTSSNTTLVLLLPLMRLNQVGACSISFTFTNNVLKKSAWKESETCLKTLSKSPPSARIAI
jgi:hypothetical protein